MNQLISHVFLILIDSIIERISLPFAKRILKVTPPVPRRAGWDKDDESSVFFIKFRTDDGRNEVRISYMSQDI